MKRSFHPRGLFLSVIGITLIVVFAAGRVHAEQKSHDRLLSGHTEAVESVVFLPDGVRAISGSRDKTLKLWNVQTGKLIRTYKGHEGAVFSVAVLPGGKQVASGSADHTVRVWDVESGDQVGQLDGHTGDVRGLAVLPDGKLVSGGGDGLRVWDVEHEKLIWKGVSNGGGVRTMSVSADGKRLAFGTMFDGTARVWDLVAHKEIADLGGSEWFAVYAAITPDGKEVVCQYGDAHAPGRFSVDTRKQLPIPDGWELLEGFTFTPNGRKAIFSRTQIQVVDWPSGKVLAVFMPGTTQEYERTHCMALSPDGKTLLAGRGGFETTNNAWKPTRGNGIEVFTIPDSASPAPQGPPTGMLSWDVLPAKVKTLRGDVIPLEQWQWPAGEASSYAQASKMEFLAKDLDVWWTAKSVMFHRGDGLLEEVLIDGTAGYSGVVWDGENAWVSSLKHSVLVLDLEGKIVDRGSDLPECKYALKLFPLSPGKVLAAGTSVDDKGNPAHAWLAILQRQAGGVVTKVFFKDSQLPREWEQDVNVQGAPSFRPNWFSEPPPAKPGGDRIVWIGCTGVSGGVPVLQVNVNRLTAVPYNIRPAGAQRTPPMAGFGAEVPPMWLSSAECVTAQDPRELSRCTVRAGYTPGTDVKLLAETGWRSYHPTLLSLSGRLLLAGERWFRIDPRTMEIVDMGPGLRHGGQLITSDIDYLVSAHLGLAAFSKADNCFYRISVDPAHPAAVRASEDLPQGKPVPSEGAVSENDGATQFVRGEVFYLFDNQTGRLLQQDWGSPWLKRRSVTDDESDRLASYRARLVRYPEERERVGVSADQMKRLDAVARGEGALSPFPPAPNKERLEMYFSAYRSATDEAGRERAAKLLLSMAGSTSDQRAKSRQEYVARMKAAFTPRQLQLLAYQVVTEPK
jgi:WD domain, G-beta repeat